MAWFIGVGCAAAVVHWGVAVSLMNRADWPPLLANIGGWVMALGVSFGGHSRFSFGGRGAPLRAAAWRFLLVSAAGFAVNECAFAVLLRVSSWRHEGLLAGVLLGVAAATYLLSRHWVFLQRAPS